MAAEKYGSEILHSLYGRLFGLDARGFAVGLPGLREPTEFSTAGSTLAAHGLSVLSGSTDAWTLPAPRAAGVRKTILNASTLSTAAMAIVRSTADGFDCAFFGSTVAGGLGSTAPTIRINLVAAGAAVDLISVSSRIWAPIGFTGNITSSAQTYTLSTTS
jgi:hypothetical protein